MQLQRSRLEFRAAGLTLPEFAPWAVAFATELPKGATWYTMWLAGSPLGGPAYSQEARSGQQPSVLVKPAAARYWRLYIDDNWGAKWGMGLNEIKLKSRAAPRHVLPADVASEANGEHFPHFEREVPGQQVQDGNHKGHAATATARTSRLRSMAASLDDSGAERALEHHLTDEQAIVAADERKIKAMDRVDSRDRSKLERVEFKDRDIVRYGAAVSVAAAVLLLLAGLRLSSSRRRPKVSVVDSCSQYTAVDTALGLSSSSAHYGAYGGGGETPSVQQQEAQKQVAKPLPTGSARYDDTV